MKDKKRISLATYVISLIVMAVIAGIIIIVILNQKQDTAENNKQKGNIENTTIEDVQNIYTNEEKENGNYQDNEKENKEYLEKDIIISEDEDTEETERTEFETVHVFKFDAEKSDAQDCEPYILLWENVLLFAKGGNVEAESTYFYANYKINSDNSITLSDIETQDNAFFNAADAYLETIDGDEYMVFSDGYSVVCYKFVEYYEMR